MLGELYYAYTNTEYNIVRYEAIGKNVLALLLVSFVYNSLKQNIIIICKTLL